MSIKPTMHEVFRGALMLIKEDGWSGGDWQDGPKLCLVQAVMSVQGIDGRQTPWALPVEQLRVLDSVLTGYTDYRHNRLHIFSTASIPVTPARIMCEAIMSWNDAKSRKQFEVEWVLRKAAVVAEDNFWRDGIRQLAANEYADVCASIQAVEADKQLVTA